MKQLLHKLYKYRYPILLVLAVCWGAFLRLYRLAELPQGLYPDVGANGLDVQDLLKGDLQPFYHRNGGREGMFFYLAAPLLALMGNQPQVLYLTSAVIGIATLPVMYWFGKEFFNRRIGILSTLLLASSFFHINFSRLGYRVILLPLFMMLSLITLKRAFRLRTNRTWIIAGIVFALGFYTYLAYRLYPMVLIVLWLLWRGKKTDRIKMDKSEQKAFWIPAALVLTPLVIYSIVYPVSAWSRIFSASLLVSQTGSGPASLLDRILGTLGMFHFRGDHISQYNISNQPLLPIWEGTLMLIGIALLIRKRQRISSQVSGMLLILMILPVLLTDDVPHYLRGFGIITVLYPIIALGIDWLSKSLSKSFNRSVSLVVCGAVICLSAATGYTYYFYNWAQQPDQDKTFYTDLVHMADYAAGLEVDQPVFFILGSIQLGEDRVPAEIRQWLAPLPDPIADMLTSAFDPKRSLEEDIDHERLYFWEGNSIKYLLRDSIDYEVRAKHELNQDEQGIYIFSSLWHPDFRELLIDVFPEAQPVEQNEYFEAWVVTS